MVEASAYALGVAELRGVVGATGSRRDQLRTLTQQAFASRARPLAVRDLIGPLYRRVPGLPVLREDDPTPADLDTLLAGDLVLSARATATWRLLEVVVGELAWASTRVRNGDLPAGLLAPTGLPVPPVDGLNVGWCTVARATAVRDLTRWLTGSDDWARQAAQVGRPEPDVVVFSVR